MSRIVQCQKLGKKAPGLEQPPYPGELGERIYDSISSEAWQLWIQHQTMLINEYRLNLLELEARKFLKTQMENFLFGQGADKPAGFVPPEKK